MPPSARGSPRIGVTGELDRRAAAIDICIYLVGAFLMLGFERGLERGGLLPWPDLVKGAPTLIGSLVLVIAIQRRRGHGLRHVGFRRPDRWWFIPAWGLAVLLVSVALQLTLVPMLGSLLGVPDPDFSRYDALEGNLPLYLLTVTGAMFTGGFIEEVIFRGLMIDRINRILGDGSRAAAGAALLSGLAFGVVHFEWGIGGIVMTSAMGTGLSFMYLATGRNIWPLIAGHATLDFILISTLYLGAIE